VPRKRRKPLKNSRKARKGGRRFTFLGSFMMGFKLLLAVAAVIIASGFFILVHDLVTQSDYFKARQLNIEGMQRLTREQVARQAGVYPGINILYANLTLARRRLLAHPWIAEAEVSREIPDSLHIAIKEHTAMAAVDFGQKYLMNTRGEIFKARDSSDPQDLPVISGLRLSEVAIYGRSRPLQRNSDHPESAPVQAVMRVLRLGGKKGSILPNRDVKQIHVDRQTGLTIHAYESGRTINLGFSDYVGKYRMLSRLFSYVKRNRNISDFKRIDLNNLQRIVVNPIRIESLNKGS